jgi:aldose 1-epimerase
VRFIFSASFLLVGVLLLGTSSCQDSTSSTKDSGQRARQQVKNDSLATPPVRVVSFGHTPDGTPVHLYTLTNAHGLTATVSTYGATLTSLQVPDKHGRLSNIVLGFERLNDYLAPRYRHLYPAFGSATSRAALGFADQSKHPSSRKQPGSAQAVWHATPGLTFRGEPSLSLLYRSLQDELGYQSNLVIKVNYELSQGNELSISYEATTDKLTPVNLTNSIYFNLDYGRSRTVLDHIITIPAERYLVLDPQHLPTGEMRQVSGTTYDFRRPQPLRQHFTEQVTAFDHSWALFDFQPESTAPAFTVYDPKSGRTLEMFTTQVVTYLNTGDKLDGKLVGRGNVRYEKNAGFCLTAQGFPTAAEHSTFLSNLLGPGMTTYATNVYRFGIRP